jgi:hypothetical protein
MNVILFAPIHVGVHRALREEEEMTPTEKNREKAAFQKETKRKLTQGLTPISCDVTHCHRTPVV